MDWSSLLLLAADAAPADASTNPWNQGWVFALGGAAGTVIGAISTALINVAKFRADAKKQARKDAIDEWQAIVTRQETSIVELTKRCETLDKRVYEAVQANIDCERHHAETREELAHQRAIVESLTQDVRRLQIIAREAPPASVMPCTITADVKEGIIRTVTGASGPIFGWMPEELRGRKVDLLMAFDVVGKHREAFTEIQQGKRKLVNGKIIHGRALKQSGEEVPVEVVLWGWETGSGEMMINADIRVELNAAARPKDRPEPEPHAEPCP